jgi:hypothetical protein
VAQFLENNSLANADALAKVLLLVSTAAAAAKTRCQDKPGQVELACQLGLLVDTPWRRRRRKKQLYYIRA